MNQVRFAVVWAAVLAAALSGGVASALEPCRIEVVESGSGWPVPLVELRTTHHARYVTDNAGVIALDAPELMGREVYFSVHGHGYEVQPDGFGFRGVRLTPQPGKTLKVEVRRTIIARRLGRLTGAGLFAESRRSGDAIGLDETGVFGCDSIQAAEHRGRLFHLWGDTTMPHYPLGIFHMSGATTALKPLDRFEPPLMLKYDHFRNDRGVVRNVAEMPGEGPTWLTGFVSLPDAKGEAKLVASYMKIKPPLEAYQLGLCVWNDEAAKFEQHRVLWTKSSDSPREPAYPNGHPTIHPDEDAKPWVYFGDPFPTLRFPATFEAWSDPATWQTLKPQEHVASAADGSKVVPHRGSIAYSAYRKRWVTVFTQTFGKPSAFGELWYAEADAPTGPWGPAVKVLSHDNYTFYNPRLHKSYTDADSPILIFEGTYSHTFADRPEPTPRYDYNQMLYRLDLDDPRLRPAAGR